ncbi:MAG: hypothetical protein WD200_04155 [Candidatus Andersenbacteria bacterium]
MKMVIVDATVAESGDAQSRIQLLQESGWEVFLIPSLDEKAEGRMIKCVQAATHKVAVLRSCHPRAQAFRDLGCTIRHAFDERAMMVATECLLPALATEESA